MKSISLSALNTQQRAVIAAARVTGTSPVVLGNFGKRCQNCQQNRPIKGGFLPDPARKFREVCTHCARLRTPACDWSVG